MDSEDMIYTNLRQEPMEGLLPSYPRPLDKMREALNDILCVSGDDAFRVTRILGQGAPSITCEGVSSQGRKVAIKILYPVLTICESPDKYFQILNRFISEGQNGKSLDHPNIVDIIDIGITKQAHSNLPESNPIIGRPCLMMELIEGTSLSELDFLSRIPMPSRFYILQKITSGLQYLHKKGMNHRDIKPHNIMLTKDTKQPILIDFGVCKWPQNKRTLEIATKTGEHITTWKYMPPEIEIDAKSCTEKSDIWSFGVTAAEILRGTFIPRATFFNKKLLEEALASLDIPSIQPLIDTMVDFDRDVRPPLKVLKQVFERYENWCMDYEAVQDSNLEAVREQIIRYARGEEEYRIAIGAGWFEKEGLIPPEKFRVPNDFVVSSLSIDKFYPLISPKYDMGRGTPRGSYDFDYHLPEYAVIDYGIEKGCKCTKCGGNIHYSVLSFYVNGGLRISVYFCLGSSKKPCGNSFYRASYPEEEWVD